MRFAYPQLLWLLLVLPPAMMAFFWWSARKREQLMTRFIEARLLPGLVAGISPVRRNIRAGCLVLAVACVILALARPQWGFVWEEVKQRGLDIVIGIDTSKSMLATDIAPSRLERAKLAALDLMKLARTDRVGLVAFAGTAFLQCPLTLDDVTFKESVDSLNVNLLPQGGTALAEAINTALTAFKEGDNHKILVLLTDGEDHDSGVYEAAQRASEQGLRIFTIGIGTTEGDLLRLKDAQGGSDYVRDDQGNVVKSRLNEDLLRQIAGATEGGFYLPLRGAKAMEALYEKGLAPLPKSDAGQKLMQRYYERYHWPLGAAILLLLAEMLFPERRREVRAPTPTLTPAPSAASLAAAVIFLLGINVVLASPSSALREYKAGNYDEAQKEYEQLLKRKSDDPRLRFNAGAAAYRNEQFDEAYKQFNEALNAQDLSLQASAYYNRGNTLYWLGERSPDPKQRTDSWQKSIKDFESALKLNPQDADARFNREYVQRRLEELKQQQQQQQQQNQDQNNQDQQDQQQQPQQGQDQKDQQQQQQQTQEQKDQQQQQQEQQQAQNQEQQQQQQSRQQEQKEQQQQQAAQTAEEQEKKEEQEQAAAEGQMTPEQARQLLDAQKGDEQMLPIRPETKPVDPQRKIKDW